MVVAVGDWAREAPVHVLVIPKRHVARLTELPEGDGSLMGKLVAAANGIARDRGVAGRGYRLVINCNAEGGQSVDHLHVHLLGGRQMKWPPG